MATEAITVRVPDIGDFRDVEVIEVLVVPGQQVEKETSLITLESDKAALDIPSPAAGAVQELLVAAGDRVSEGTPILKLADTADARDWALVHDAARPCLHPEDLERLIREGAGHPVGGVLAAPVQDTLKRAGPADEIAETVPREGLWRALTPQIFRLGRLTRALEKTIRQGLAVSDEAQAMEIAYGDKPLLIRARHDNRKVTYPADLEWVRHALREAEKREPQEAR